MKNQQRICYNPHNYLMSVEKTLVRKIPTNDLDSSVYINLRRLING